MISEPIVASGGSTDTAATATTGSSDPEAQKRAFEEAVKQKMQAEMMKLQNQYMAELKQQQSKDAPVVAPAPVTTAAPAEPEERGSNSAAQLDQQRRDAARAEELAETRVPAPAPVQTQTTAPAPAPVASSPAPAPVPAAVQPTVREGDVIDVAALDVMPRPVRPITAVYPPIARQQRIAAIVVVSALINERGEVEQVKVLKGDGRFGINESATRALRSARFSAPMKDGKRVKTWFPQTIEFKP